MPGDGSTITQLGHVDDLADAMVRALAADAAANRIYNCSSRKGITFAGVVKAAALAAGKILRPSMFATSIPVGWIRKPVRPSPCG